MVDYIRREDALEAIARAFGDVAEAEDNIRAIPTCDVIKEQKNTIKSYERTIRKLVDAIERKKGVWIETYGKYGSFRHQCSECGELFGMPFDFEGKYYPYHFCPNCGADMRELPKESE